MPQLQKAGAGCSCVTPTESKVEEERFSPHEVIHPLRRCWGGRCGVCSPVPGDQPAQPGRGAGKLEEAGWWREGTLGSSHPHLPGLGSRTVNPLEERPWLPQLCE